MMLSAKITDHWLPLPESLLTDLQWKEGDRISIEVIDQTLILTKLDKTNTPVPPRVTVRRKSR